MSSACCLIVMLVANAEEEDVTTGCGLSKERGHVFSMLIVVNYRERYTNITVECGLREGERGLCPYCCGIISSWILTVKDI